MADTVTLQKAVDTAWYIFRATHSGIDDADSRRCLLERHLHGGWEIRDGDAEELASIGLAYLERLPGDEC